MVSPTLWLRCTGASALLFVLACDGDAPTDQGEGSSSEAGTELGAGESTEGDGAQTGPAPTAGDATTGADTDGGGEDTTVPTGGSATEGTACGNGVLEADEMCDGVVGLEDMSCAALGYVAGDLACAADCTALDESGCSDSAICGDGVVSETEECEMGLGDAQSCGAVGEGEGTLSCLDCGWSVTSCCAVECSDGCDDSCGGDPADLTGQWEILFFDNGWQGPDPTMIMDLVQDGAELSGSFTTDAWFLGDQEFEGGERTGNDVYMHVPIEQLSDGMIMEGTVCGGCAMTGTTDPQGGLNSAWVATRIR